MANKNLPLDFPKIDNLAVRPYPGSSKRWMVVIISAAGENVLTSRDYRLHQSHDPGAYPSIKSMERAAEIMNDWHQALQQQRKTKTKSVRGQTIFR